jgi:3-hydroxyisobutyrate dehydrogenase-like beta-hydroxyacid dehydrogenase
MMTKIAVVAPGGMGSALAERLKGEGAEVLTSLVGRSEASRARALASGMRDVGDPGLADADVILSVVPPDQALPLAQRLAEALSSAQRRPLYVDCNAVGPRLAAKIERVVVGSGVDFVDAGIIGLPPRPGTPGPTVFMSGPHATRAAALVEPFGVRTHVLDLPNGAASALKMGYAGITKGLIALAATMALAAENAGVGRELAAELARSQPNLFASFTKSVPDMLPKARRWVPEMNEIAGFIGNEIPSAEAYDAFARFYEMISHEPPLHERLAAFYNSGEVPKQA